MPYSIRVCDKLRYYTVTTPNWFCEWILGGEYVDRKCYTTNTELDIVNKDDSITIESLLPEIVEEVTKAMNDWTKAGDVYAPLLLNKQNIPMYLQYALGSKN